ncbi:MAG TPA: threonine/serine exporter family protein, partial [Kribbella sp.]|nr:threonine/serine exporter family protein [Kribbella sp.]
MRSTDHAQQDEPTPEQLPGTGPEQADQPGVERRGRERRGDDRRGRDEQRELYRTMDLALRIGEVVLSSGAGTADATATILAVTAAGGL